MKPNYIITTQRLGLRNWQDSDLIPFSEMCKDKAVMNYFPNTLSKTESKDLIERLKSHYLKFGFCYFAVDVLKTNKFIGFTGLLNQTYKSSFTPCIDIGWRLKQSAWGNGYATEAAQACLQFAFNTLNIKEIFAFAASKNKASEATMKKIGMKYISTFEHPKLVNTTLNPCIAYKITN